MRQQIKQWGGYRERYKGDAQFRKHVRAIGAGALAGLTLLASALLGSPDKASEEKVSDKTDEGSSQPQEYYCDNTLQADGLTGSVKRLEDGERRQFELISGLGFYNEDHVELTHDQWMDVVDAGKEYILDKERNARIGAEVADLARRVVELAESGKIDGFTFTTHNPAQQAFGLGTLRLESDTVKMKFTMVRKEDGTFDAESTRYASITTENGETVVMGLVPNSEAMVWGFNMRQEPNSENVVPHIWNSFETGGAVVADERPNRPLPYGGQFCLSVPENKRNERNSFGVFYGALDNLTETASKSSR